MTAHNTDVNRKRTMKQEKFAQKVVELGSLSAAYRSAFPKSVNWTPNALHVEASRLKDQPNVKARIKELIDGALETHTITAADLVAELEESRQRALEGHGKEKVPQVSASVAATMGKAKILKMFDDNQTQDKEFHFHLHAPGDDVPEDEQEGE